jgi:hypothetical protein
MNDAPPKGLAWRLFQEKTEPKIALVKDFPRLSLLKWVAIYSPNSVRVQFRSSCSDGSWHWKEMLKMLSVAEINFAVLATCFEPVDAIFERLAHRHHQHES